MKITRAEAEAYFAHPSQLRGGMIESPDDLPEWCRYYAQGGVCLIAHGGHWPGLVMVHLGAKPEAWGGVTIPARELLAEIWATESPERIAGWVKDNNRPMAALCRRLAMKIDGRLPLAVPVTLYGWRP